MVIDRFMTACRTARFLFCLRFASVWCRARMASMASKQTHYDVLQISHTATANQIKAAYHSLILRCHPDKLPSIPTNVDRAFGKTKSSESLSAIDMDQEDEASDENARDSSNKSVDISPSIAAEMHFPAAPWTDEGASTQTTTTFHHIHAAYNCLRDPEKRRQYDESMSRNEEREERKWKASSSVNLSEMECDWCCVVDEGDSENMCTADGDAALHKVYFYPCRCGDTFQVVEEELLETINNVKRWDKHGMFTSRVWQCESCSLTIRIHIDINIK
ncbi:hypothetical protein ACHAW5_003190 [Stephanodiscus triporus]|uniref:J domain-containing protein n=1 Tax=Stephanodiscus triporus TaxID=2934178 RepID=A0ABD3MDG6_9STRA